MLYVRDTHLHSIRYVGEDNTSLGEFTLAPIPPMKAGDAVLEVVFEVDVNGILKVTGKYIIHQNTHIRPRNRDIC